MTTTRGCHLRWTTRLLKLQKLHVLHPAQLDLWLDSWLSERVSRSTAYCCLISFANEVLPAPKTSQTDAFWRAFSSRVVSFRKGDVGSGTGKASQSGLGDM